MKRRCIPTLCPLCEKEVGAIVVEDCEGGYKMLRCPMCKLEFAHPLKGLGKEGYEGLYKEGAWRERFILQAMEKPRLESRHLWAIKSLKRIYPSPDNRKILDAGCGEGGFLKVMGRIGFEVYGFDIAEEPIRFAREVYGLENVIVGTIEDLPKDWGDFHIITAFAVFEHLENPLQFLRSLYNRLKPGGLLLLSVPHYEGISYTKKKSGANWDNPPEHLTRWPPKTLRLALEKVGFSQIKFHSLRNAPEEAPRLRIAVAWRFPEGQ